MRTNIEEIRFYHEFINMIDKKIGLTPYQKEKLRTFDSFYPYYIFKDKPKIKTTLLWRLTIPFYVIYCLIFGIIISPIKYIITGNRYESHNSISYKIYNKWSSKINLYI